MSEKAVRDIWTGRTWSKETCHLDESRPFPTKKMGRPLGRKDAQPRKPKSLLTIPESSNISQTAIDVSLKPQSIDMEPAFSLEMNELHETHKKESEEVPASAWCWHDPSIDELLHVKTQCEFDTAFEDPFGPDWAAVHRSLQQSMRQ